MKEDVEAVVKLRQKTIVFCVVPNVMRAFSVLADKMKKEVYRNETNAFSWDDIRVNGGISVVSM